MDFESSGLPQDHRIKRCFERIQEIYKAGLNNDADDMIQQLTQVGCILAEASPMDNPPVPLICASFLIYLPENTYEFDNIRHDYGYDVFQAVKTQKSFHPLFRTADFLSEVLQDREIHPDVRMLYIAKSIMGLRHLAQSFRQDPKLTENAAMFESYEACVLTGKGCRGASNALDYFFEEEAKTCHALLRGEPAHRPQQPARQRSGQKPILH